MTFSAPFARKLSCFLIIAVAVLAVAAVQADDGARKLEGADRQVIAESASWGVITPLADGSLGIAMKRARPLQEIDAVNVSMEWIRSVDGGKTWSEPVLISERRGSEGDLFQRRPDGGYIVYQERAQAVGQLPSGRIVCAWVRLDYYHDANGKPEPRPGVPHNHQTPGAAYTWSDDLGKTWVQTRWLDTGPFGGTGYGARHPHWRILTLEDGTAMMSLFGEYDPEYDGPLEIPAGTRSLAGVIRSTDNGETWGDLSLFLTKESPDNWEETALCLVDNQKLIAHVRTPRHNIVQYTSVDDGRTWAGPEDVTEPGQQPGGAYQLASGKLLCTWGNRREPFGAVAMLSTDGGVTWDYEHRVALATDGEGFNCGYANGAQAGDGTIVVVYYVMPASGDYRTQWQRSTVRVIRFTEEEFLEARR